jgi:hypothetical protein
MSASSRPFLLASAFLLAALPAVASDETVGAPVASPAPRATLHCPGVSSIPMNAEQVLPLRLLRNLSCNESVAILSDVEGYTVHVRTSDGKEGYVARLYLNMNGSAATVPDQQPASATAVNNVVRWQAGAPGCDQLFSKGHAIESATANGITVQVSLEDSGWKLRATVAVSNKGEEVVEIFPILVTLDELQPNLRALLAQDPAKLSHVVNHQVLLTEATDYFSDHLVQASASNHAAIVPSAAELKSLALKHTKLAPGQNTTGVIWFQRDANARELSLRVPVGDLVFDFPLSFGQKH